MRRYTIELPLGQSRTGDEQYSLPICCVASAIGKVAALLEPREWLYVRTFENAHSAEYWRVHGILPR